MVTALLTLLVPFNALGDGSVGAQTAELNPVVRSASRWDTSPPLRDLALNQPEMLAPDQALEIPLHSLPKPQLAGAVPEVDSVVQKSFLGVSAPPTIANFEGLNNVNNVLPPDTNGDIGPNHYVQIVNLSFAVYDRNGNLLLGPLNNNTIFQGFEGQCYTTNNGDPIVLYDHLADRWLFSQFAIPDPYYQCIAVSATGDPTGQWHRYEFPISQTKLNDYPKFGVWPDGYYMTVNQFEYDSGWNWAGQGVAAFERDRMLVGGDPAPRMIFFDLSTVDETLGGMLPADLDGPPPPQGSPNPFVQMDDDAWGYSPDQLQVWNFSVNWAAPSASFTFQGALPTALFNSVMCDYNRNCIPQPGGSAVDAISDRLMYRLQYRNFGDHQSLVVNHTVDVGNDDHAGVRWYEMRKTGGGWSIFQQGTWAPDSDHRWMGSVAMNSKGDIGLGYSVSSTTTYPSIRFTGRLAEDPPGQMTFSEGEIITGSGYQTSSSGRWGDYSMMAVDPVDDCTFWYTQEYYAVSGDRPWRTRIASFKLRECGNPVILYFPLMYK